MQNDASFLATLEQPCMAARLVDGLQEAWRELRESPKAYLVSTLKGYTNDRRRQSLLRFGLAIGISFYAITFLSILLFWSLAHSRSRAAGDPGSPTCILKLPGYWPKIKMPVGDNDGGGGGGGGRHTMTLPSLGEPPSFSLTSPVIAPRPESQPHPPSLPVIETVMVDPRLEVKRDDLSPTGERDGAIIPPSAGPGSDGGVGTGARGGIGPGVGNGLGPGFEGNTGGERFKLGGKPKTGHQQIVVDSLPVLLNHPRPLFTEEARRNKIQGIVRVKVLIEATGAVKEVVVTRGLPDGLSEQAIRAAYEMRFRPAMKDGRPVPYWLNSVEVEFNLR
jgi:TonB family protein